MIEDTRIFHLLSGNRDTPGVNFPQLAGTLVKISQLICDFSQMVTLDINPLLCDCHGVLALDARLRIVAASPSVDRRMAICPYPAELEKQIDLPGGKKLLLRPIRPEDEPAFQRLFSTLSPEDIRLRFLHPMKLLPKALAARLTQIDYNREMALVLTDADGNLHGVVRYSADPNNENAEFAILLGKEDWV